MEGGEKKEWKKTGDKIGAETVYIYEVRAAFFTFDLPSLINHVSPETRAPGDSWRS